MSDTAITSEAGKGLTLESVWALFRETDARMAENDRRINEKFDKIAEDRAEADARWERLRETVEKTSKTVEETSRKVEETSRKVGETSRNIDGVNRTLGDWTEEMVRAQLWKKFDSVGFTFTKGGRMVFRNRKKQIIAEVDAFLENGDYAMPVEIKSQFTTQDIDGHIKRIEVLRGYMDERNDKRKLVGCIAGAVVPDDVRRYAHRNGLYVIVQSGDSVVLAKTPEDFKPREW